MRNNVIYDYGGIASGMTGDRLRGGWPPCLSGPAPADGDRDGMPDEWERARGLDPGDPRDGAGVAGREGFTHLEVYLNERAGGAIP